MKARRLKRLRVKRVDLVARGANQEADVLLFKSEDPPMVRCPKCNEETKKGTKFCHGCGAKMPDEAAKSAAKETSMTEEIQKLQEDLAAANKRATEAEEKRVAVEKAQGETIATLKTRLDEAETRIKKADDETRLARFRKAAESFEHLPVKADTFSVILMKCAAALDEAGYVELMRVLKAGDAAGTDLFHERGAPGDNSQERSAAEEIDAKADELVAKGIKKPDAMAQVMASNPALAARYRRESTVRDRRES